MDDTMGSPLDPGIGSQTVEACDAHRLILANWVLDLAFDFTDLVLSLLTSLCCTGPHSS